METQVKQSPRKDGSTTWRPSEQFPSAGSTLRLAMVVETPEIRADLADALREVGSGALFEMNPNVPALDVTAAVERDRPELLFVETALLTKSPAEWISEIRRGGDLPLIVAIHTGQDTGEMIGALRAGASEFLSLPLRPAFFEAMDRTAAILETRRAAMTERGKVLGFLSAKGGCGASTIACHVASALTQTHGGKSVRCLLADLDYHASSSASVFKISPKFHAFDAFEQVRRVNSSSWRDIVVPVTPQLDLLGGTCMNTPATPEPWRIEALFRFASRNYGFVCVDLGRHLTPANWAFLQNIEELFLITGPDVLALYQTRAILQALTNRGFEKNRVRLILNLNQNGPQDFWKESIEQMFELQVYFCLPNDEARGASSRGERWEYPADTDFGRHLMKLAAKIAGVSQAKPGGSGLFRRG